MKKVKRKKYKKNKGKNIRGENCHRKSWLFVQKRWINFWGVLGLLLKISILITRNQ